MAVVLPAPQLRKLHEDDLNQEQRVGVQPVPAHMDTICRLLCNPARFLNLTQASTEERPSVCVLLPQQEDDACCMVLTQDGMMGCCSLAVDAGRGDDPAPEPGHLCRCLRDDAGGCQDLWCDAACRAQHGPPVPECTVTAVRSRCSMCATFWGLNLPCKAHKR